MKSTFTTCVSTDDSSAKYRRSAEQLKASPCSRMRPRMAVGALIGAAIPYAYGVYEHGSMTFGGNIEAIVIFGGICLICALIGAGAATSSIGQGGRLPDASILDEKPLGLSQDDKDLIAQTGIYTSMRDAWDPNYQRNSRY